MHRTLLATLTLCSLVALAPLTLAADSAAPSLVASFNPAAGELPESVTADDDGNFYLSMGHTIRKLTPDGVLHDFAELTPTSGLTFATGVKIGPDGQLYAAVASFDPGDGAAAVWRISPSGAAVELAHLDDAGFPNDLAFDDHGDIFVTDPFLGRVWKIDAATGGTSVWLDDPSLLGDPPAGYLLLHDFGADGIAFDKRKDNLYIGNLDHGQIIRVPVERDGSAGTPSVWVDDPRLDGCDGIAFDQKGDLYVAVNGQDQVVSINPSGAITVVASGGALDGPSSLVFGQHGADKKKLFISSFAVSSAFGTPLGHHSPPSPGLLSLPVKYHGAAIP